jgi:Spx/MgsR family transcriptional regulator
MMNAQTVLYGIPNCDSVKKARRWLDDRGISYRFHDFRADGLTREQVADWLAALGWETLVNRRSSSWKALSEGARAAMSDDSAITHILEAPTLIKRPLLARGDTLTVGFSETAYRDLFEA